MIKRLVFLVEGKSERALIYSLMPRLLGEKKLYYRCLSFEGKNDLKKRMAYKLQSWNYDDMFFIILCDRDDEDCKTLKNTLLSIIAKSGNKNIVVRIAVRELESWYLGDLDSVVKALSLKGFNKAHYPDPDNIRRKPSLELEIITKGLYQKVSGSREIGKHITLDENKNTSVSYGFFLKALKKIIEENHLQE